jgi:hypothetical protein
MKTEEEIRIRIKFLYACKQETDNIINIELKIAELKWVLDK